MSDFDKKKTGKNRIYNIIEADHKASEEEYEIPDIVSGTDAAHHSGKEKKARQERPARHHFENRMSHKKEDILDDLEFISEETVKDKSKMADGKPIRHADVSRKKTLRRSVDEREAKKEKSVAFVRRNLAFVGIGCLAVVVVIAAASIGIKKMRAKKAEENQNLALSAQEYETDEYEEINTLIENYYDSYAAGNTADMLEFANPITDMEKSYISMYSQYIERYDNIVCYTKTSDEEGAYLVSVAYDLKYKNVDTAAPGLELFYVRTNENGSVYIDNVYSAFNLSYQENALDETVTQMLATYREETDVIALQASVQTRFDDAAASDENLKTMVETTIPNAVAAWEAEWQAAEQQKAQEAAQKVQEEEAAAAAAAAAQAAEQGAPDQNTTDQNTADQNTADQNTDQNTDQNGSEQTAVTETEQRAWVYATETMRIRQEPNEQSAVLASAVQGAELRQIAVTSDGWSKVQTGDIVGYVKTEYLTTGGQ